MPLQYPKDFTPDLRRLKSWPSMVRSLWRQPYLIELTYAENFRLVRESIRGRNLRILEVGSGTGFMSLELARMGHYVTALERNKDLVTLAERSLRTSPYRKTSGTLYYDQSDFITWTGKPQTYDMILFSRVLHDMPRPDSVISKAHELLKNRGSIICLEYAYDMMDRKAAIWLYQVRRTLEVISSSKPSHLPGNPRIGVDRILERNSKRKQHINTFEEMRQPLRRFFRQKRLSWHPYYFWDILGDARIPDERREKSLATLLRHMEEFLIESGEIQPVLFRFVGTKKQ